MRVVLTVDPYIPVPPRLYGGIERVVGQLADGLVKRGHAVTMFAHPDSSAPVRLRAYGAPPHTGPVRRAWELMQVGGGLLGEWRDADIVHSFGRLAALLPILPIRTLPKIQSYGRTIPWRGVRRAVALAGPSLCFTACSTRMYSAAGASERRGRWETIFNGVDLDRFTARTSVPADAPLMFLGRVERQKGPHHAVAIARRAGRRLVIAGNVERSDQAFFEREVKPFVDGEQIVYVGAVDDVQKNLWLGRAAALLMPIECEEAFGIVMAEAMACGTPVIAFPRGSVPEVVREGVNGFIRDGIEAAADAVPLLPRLDRAAVRRDCETRFADPLIVDQYEQLYMDMIDRTRARRSA
jgi:glycosyltransferase involved in cell wall biosynthesis